MVLLLRQKSIALLLLSILIGAGFITTGCKSSKTTHRGSGDAVQVTVAGKEGVWDAGFVELESEHHVSFILQNKTDMPLQIKRVRSECECMEAVEPPEEVAAGGEEAIRVKFVAPEKRMQYSKRIILQTSDPSRPIVALRITAMVGLPLDVQPGEVNFGAVAAGETYKKNIVIHNHGSKPVRPAYATSKDLSCIAQVPRMTIAPGGSGEMPVVLQVKPDAAGIHKSDITIHTDSSEQPEVKVAVAYGVGVEPTADTPKAGGSGCDKPGCPSAKAGGLRIVLFYSPTCPGCEKVEKALDAVARKYGSKVIVQRCSLDDPEGKNLAAMFRYEDHYKAKETAALKAFVGTQYLAGKDSIAENIDKVVADELAAGAVTFLPTGEAETNDIMARFEGFGVWAVAAAGLLDGINPCAFTTIIFLLSMLAYLGKNRRQLAAVGLGFTVSVFVTYFLLGLGAFGAIKTISSNYGVARALAYGVAVLAFVLAAWSIVDVIRYLRSRDVKKVTLGLPKAVKAQIHKVIRSGLKTRGLVVGSIVVGFLVALLESLCTGQVYLPTIVFVARSSTMRGDAIAYLLFYNLMFILPLIGVFIVAYCGVSSERMGRLLRSNLAVVKLAMALLFAALGILVLTTI